MSEAVTATNLTIMNSTISEESLARDRQTHRQTDRQTDRHGLVYVNLLK